MGGSIREVHRLGILYGTTKIRSCHVGAASTTRARSRFGIWDVPASASAGRDVPDTEPAAGTRGRGSADVERPDLRRPVEDPQTVNLSDGAAHVGAAALVGNLKEAPRNPTR